MFGILKEKINSLVFGTKGLFAPSKSQTYVTDLRRAVTHNVIKDEKNIEGRQCRYPKNYHDVVEEGTIQIRKDSRGDPMPGKYELLFGKKNNEEKQPSFPLALVIKGISKETPPTEIPYEDGNKFYFTLEDLVGKDPNDRADYSKIYKPFGFSKKDLETCLPVFEVENINADQKQGKDPIYKLTNSSVVTKKVNGKEVLDKKCRNGELLYTSNSGPFNIYFFAIKDERDNLELAKSLFISVPIMFVTTLLKICAKCVTFPFKKTGEYLLDKQNPIAKAFGYGFFTPVAIIQNVANMVATILRAPILLFTANKEKYGDAYYTMWKEQIKECWNDAKSDRNVITKGTREEGKEGKKEESQPHQMMGTWNELNARRPEIARKPEIKDRLKGLKSRSGSTEIIHSNKTVVHSDNTKTPFPEVSSGYAKTEEENRKRRASTASTISMK